MTSGRLRKVQALAQRCSEAKARELYREVYGAQAADSVPERRVRASIAEACAELLARNEERSGT